MLAVGDALDAFYLASFRFGLQFAAGSQLLGGAHLRCGSHGHGSRAAHGFRASARHVGIGPVNVASALAAVSRLRGVGCRSGHAQELVPRSACTAPSAAASSPPPSLGRLAFGSWSQTTWRSIATSFGSRGCSRGRAPASEVAVRAGRSTNGLVCGRCRRRWLSTAPSSPAASSGALLWFGRRRH